MSSSVYESSKHLHSHLGVSAACELRIGITTKQKKENGEVSRNETGTRPHSSCMSAEIPQPMTMLDDRSVKMRYVPYIPRDF